MENKTDYLFAMPSFFNGMASSMDISGSLNKMYNDSHTSNEADAKAIRMDWAIIGDVLRGVIKSYESK